MLLTTAQVNIDGMVERMTNDLFWSEPTYYQQMSEELTWYFEKLVEVSFAVSGMFMLPHSPYIMVDGCTMILCPEKKKGIELWYDLMKGHEQVMDRMR